MSVPRLQQKKSFRICLFLFGTSEQHYLIDNVSSYFFIAVKHRVLNTIESQIVHKKYWDYYKNFIPRHENLTEQTVEFNDLLEAIEKRIEHLPEKSKKVFRLNHFEGHSIAEIANTLKLSEKAIQYHLTRSIKELRLHLKDFIYFAGYVVFLSDVLKFSQQSVKTVAGQQASPANINGESLMRCEIQFFHNFECSSSCIILKSDHANFINWMEEKIGCNTWITSGVAP